MNLANDIAEIRRHVYSPRVYTAPPPPPPLPRPVVFCLGLLAGIFCTACIFIFLK